MFSAALGKNTQNKNQSKLRGRRSAWVWICANESQMSSIQSARRINLKFPQIRPTEGKNFDFSGFVRFFRHIPQADQSFLILGQSEKPAQKTDKIESYSIRIEYDSKVFQKTINILDYWLCF